MPGRQALLLLGGSWHDFEGFASALRPLLGDHGWHLEASYDLDRLLHLEQEQPRLVVTYTCFSTPGETPSPAGPDRMTDAQVAALTQWVRHGGGLLAAHASTVLGRSSALLGDLLGGVFVEHPPLASFAVYPVYGHHPIIAGIGAFTVHDELYMAKCAPDVRVQMVALKAGVVYPQVWSRSDGQGRVAHVALGHSRDVWALEPYRKLMVQAADWLAGGWREG
jgi:type 1 glutamine amidotransferase